MNFKVVRVQEKDKDWKLVDIEMGLNSYEHNVSVNRVNKKGEVFPGFDDIAVGKEVEGELWQSSSSKWYLFAPRQKPARSPAQRTATIERTMEKKEQAIIAAQTRKEDAILRAAAFRDATLVTVELIKHGSIIPEKEEVRAAWRDWVKFFISASDEPFI